MNKLVVVIAPCVLQQIDGQVEFIAKHSMRTALAWENRLMEALEKLAEFHGHAVDEEARNRVGGSPRRMVFEKTYLIHYEVDDEASVVRILNFRRGARRPTLDEPSLRWVNKCRLRINKHDALNKFASSTSISFDGRSNHCCHRLTPVNSSESTWIAVSLRFMRMIALQWRACWHDFPGRWHF